MMRIAFDATPLVGDLISGIGWCEAYLVDALTELYPAHQYRYEYFTLRSPEEKIRRMEKFRKENIPLRSAVMSPLLYRMASNFVPVPYSAFFGDWADITHFFNYIVPPKVHGKTVVTVHDMVLHAYPETMRRRTREMLRLGLKKSMQRADCIVTDSEFSKSEIEKYYPQYADKVRVVPCGVDTKRFYPVEDADTVAAVKAAHGIEGEYFLYLGTLEPRKNLERLIQAYALLRQEHPEAPKLVLAGGKGWMYDTIFETVKMLHLEDKVVFPSYIPSEDMAALYSGATAFVFPSLYEGFGMPPLEAMACGTPVITSNAASLPEAVGNAAVLVNPYKVEAIAKAMEILMEDPALRARLKRLGLRRAKEMSWENAAKKLYSIYESLV